MDDFIAHRGSLYNGITHPKKHDLVPKERKSTKNVKTTGIFNFDFIHNEDIATHGEDASLFDRIQAKINRMHFLYDDRLNRFSKSLE